MGRRKNTSSRVFLSDGRPAAAAVSMRGFKLFGHGKLLPVPQQTVNYEIMGLPAASEGPRRCIFFCSREVIL